MSSNENLPEPESPDSNHDQKEQQSEYDRIRAALEGAAALPQRRRKRRRTDHQNGAGDDNDHPSDLVPGSQDYYAALMRTVQRSSDFLEEAAIRLFAVKENMPPRSEHQWVGDMIVSNLARFDVEIQREFEEKIFGAMMECRRKQLERMLKQKQVKDAS